MKKTLTIIGFLAVFPVGAALADDDGRLAAARCCCHAG